MHVCMYACRQARMYVCRHVCMREGTEARGGAHLCMYVCMYAGRHVCMYVCRHVGMREGTAARGGAHIEPASAAKVPRGERARNRRVLCVPDEAEEPGGGEGEERRPSPSREGYV